MSLVASFDVKQGHAPARSHRRRKRFEAVEGRTPVAAQTGEKGNTVAHEFANLQAERAVVRFG